MIAEEYRETDWGYRPAINARDKRARALRDAGLTVDVQTLRTVHAHRDGTLRFGKVARLIAYAPDELVVATPGAPPEGLPEGPPTAEVTIPAAGDAFSSASAVAQKAPPETTAAPVPEGVPDVTLRAWSNLDAYADLDDLSAAAAQAHDLLKGAGEAGLETHEGGLEGSHMDIWARGPERAMKPLLARLHKERGHSYVLDVFVDVTEDVESEGQARQIADQQGERIREELGAAVSYLSDVEPE